MECVGPINTPILSLQHPYLRSTTPAAAASTATTKIQVQPSCSTSNSGGGSSSNSSLANPDDFIPHKTKPNTSQTHHLFLSKPSFIIRSQSNVRMERRRIPGHCCVICQGSGRVDCHYCHGKGRTNYSDLMMLPRGEWPKWCKTCGGSGLGYCPRCLGTGEYRDVMGFHFMKREETRDSSRDHGRHQVREKAERLSAADLFLSQTYSDQNNGNYSNK